MPNLCNLLMHSCFRLNNHFPLSEEGIKLEMLCESELTNKV